MFIFTVTEEVAGSVAKTFTIIIGIGLLLSPFILIANATGLPPALVIVVGLILIFALAAFLLVRSHFRRKASENARAGLMVRGQCDFLRANGTKCEKGKMRGSELCEYHADKAKAVEPLKLPAKSSTRRKMKQCGFAQEDGTKCKKLRYLEAEYCSHHAKLKRGRASST